MRTMLCYPVLTTSVSFGRFRFYLHKVLIQLCNCDITIIGYFRNQYAFPFHSYQNSVMYTFYKGLAYQNGVVALYCISKACSDISKQCMKQLNILFICFPLGLCLFSNYWSVQIDIYTNLVLKQEHFYMHCNSNEGLQTGMFCQH